VELDVRRTIDGALVVHHDAVVEGVGFIHEVAAAVLPTYVPTLAEALAACAGLVVNVEIKNLRGDPDHDPEERVTREVVELLGRREWAGGGELVVSSFSRATLRAVRAAGPDLETAWLVSPGKDVAELVELAAADGHRGIHPYDGLVDERFMELATAAGLAVRVWTVDQPSRIAELASLGAVAVVTNDVPAALSALGRGRVG
jgi:glycerophosphoryl diester phosphodiesterase